MKKDKVYVLKVTEETDNLDEYEIQVERLGQYVQKVNYDRLDRSRADWLYEFSFVDRNNNLVLGLFDFEEILFEASEEQTAKFQKQKKKAYKYNLKDAA
jgi:hypothetical protein